MKDASTDNLAASSAASVKGSAAPSTSGKTTAAGSKTNPALAAGAAEKYASELLKKTAGSSIIHFIYLFISPLAYM